MSGLSFTGIPTNQLVPLFYAKFGTGGGTGTPAQRALIIGQSATSMPMAPVWMPPAAAQASYSYAAGLFGRGSMLARMVRAYRLNDPVGELWVLPVAAPTGAATTGTIVFTGPATSPGTLSPYAGGTLAAVAVASGDTATVMGTNLAAAINANPDLPVTASAAAGTVTITARAVGVAGNGLDLRFNYNGTRAGEALPAGVVAAVTPMSGGSGTPTLTGLVAAVGAIDYDFIISGYADSASLATLSSLLSDTGGRWDYSSQEYGGVFAATTGVAATLITLGGTQNDRHRVILGLPPSPVPPEEAIAMVLGAVIPSLESLPSLPLQTTVVNALLAPADADKFNPANQNALLNVGIAQVAWDRGGNCGVVRMVTTYQTNFYGVPDNTYRDVESLYTAMTFIRTLKSAVTSKFGRSILASDGTKFGAGIPVVTPKIMKAALIAEYANMERLGICQGTAIFAAALVVQINATDPTRLDVGLNPVLTTGLRIFAALATPTLAIPT